MISTPGPEGADSQILAKQLGCKVGDAIWSNGMAQPAVIGAKGSVLDELKAGGGRWSSRHKALLFSSWEALECLLRVMIAAR